MKLLVISGAFPPTRGGEADHILYLCEHLSEYGLDVHLMTTKLDITTNAYPFKVYPLIRTWSWFEFPTLVNFIRRCSPDSILLMYSPWIYDDHPMITFTPTICKTFFPGIPFVTQCDIVEGSARYSVATRAVRRIIKQWAGQENVDYLFGTMLRDSDRIIVLCEHHLKVLSERSPTVNNKSVLIPPAPLMRICEDGADEMRQRGRNSLGVKSTEFLFAFFGYIVKYKGLETLFEAVRIVSQDRDDVRIVMIGGAREGSAAHFKKRSEKMGKYENGIHMLVEQLGLGDRIIWTNGYASQSEDASLYLRAADACVFPFDRGVSLNRSSFATAAAHGLPIITTKGEVVESPFIDGKNVILCPPKNPQALAAAMGLLMDSPRIRQQLEAGSLELARQWFSWDRAVKHTVEALKRVHE